MLLANYPVKLFSNCKINLGLQIVNILPNGWHELDSLVLPLPYPRDTIYLRKLTEPNCRVIWHKNKLNQKIELDESNNTLVKAWQVFWQKVRQREQEIADTTTAQITENIFGLEIVIKKRVPIGAGLGGGSANAAALLNYLNQNLNRPFNHVELNKIASLVGADVPLFLDNVPCRMRGIGEILEKVNLHLQGFLILIYPEIQIDTALIYRQYDFFAKNKKNCLTNPASRCHIPMPKQGDTKTCSNLLTLNDIVWQNDLEEVVFVQYPELARLKADLVEAGALALMSGSGSSIYGLFANSTALQVLTFAKQLRKNWQRVFLITL